MIDITALTTNDIAFAVSMTDAEKWGYTAEDFRRLISIEPQGCFIARENGMEIGLVTSTSYDNFGFIGSLIVKESHRGHSVGELLMRQAIECLHDKGVVTIELDGVFPALSLYRRLEFTDKYLSLRFKRLPDKNVKYKEGKSSLFSVDDIALYDLAATGLPRQHVLNTYAAEFERILFTAGNYKCKGFALVRSRAGEAMAIGPLVADSDKVAEKILSDILDRFGQRQLTIGVPAVRPEFARVLLSRGFIYTQPSVRMYRGPRREYENHIHAIFSAEKG
ncbi:MAG: GNAT family N-acetyltransferase [FCB group bacterium]|nr:GNAT family N-acetyltransferase [FCB group bacterium]